MVKKKKKMIIRLPGETEIRFQLLYKDAGMAGGKRKFKVREY